MVGGLCKAQGVVIQETIESYVRLENVGTR